MPGGILDSSAWNFEPPVQVDKSFLDTFATLLKICKDAGIQLIPSLIDWRFFDDPRSDSLYGGISVKKPTPKGLIPTNSDFIRGRRSIASNSSFRKRFVEGTLEPLLKIAADNKQVIYAFEVINEPWWCIAPITGSLFGRKMEKNDLMAFLSDCVTSIRKFGLKSTIGHRYLGDIYGAFDKVQVDLPQHHYYAGWFFDSLMSPSTMPKPAKILGEFASFTQQELDKLENKAKHEQNSDTKKGLDRQIAAMKIQVETWPQLSGKDKDPSTIVETRLKYAEQCGYELAMIWPGVVDLEDETQDVLKLDSKKLESVRRYISHQ